MENEELSLDNILSEAEILDLFGDNSDKNNQEPEKKETPDNKDNKQNDTTEINPEELFGESESVGSGGGQEEGGEPKSKEDGSSPKSQNLYSSIASACLEEGVFTNLDSEQFNADEITDSEGFSNLIQAEVEARLDETQKRVNEALTVGVQPTEIQYYENTLKNLNSITEDMLQAEGEKAENLRKGLIYQDYINRGYSKERAAKMVERAVKAGTDIDDAIDSLESNKEFFRNSYKDLVDEQKAKTLEAQKAAKKESEKLRKSILEDKQVFGDLTLDKNTRQKIFDNISKPTFVDAETGERITALQKYQKENKSDFVKNVGILFTLTDGFKNLDKLVGGKVKKEVKKGFKDLEAKLSNTGNQSFNGTFNYASGVSTEPESYINKGWTLDDSF